MRSTKQRVEATQQRITSLNRQKQIHRGYVISLLATVFCLVLITGLSFILPGIMESLSGDVGIYPGLTASIFDIFGGLGYLLIALLAFALGICVTILSYHIHLRNKEREDDE